MKTSTWIGVGLAAAFFSTAASWAQGAEPRRTAKPLLIEGASHFARHEYDAARKAFREAYEIDPAPSTLLNIAVAELNLDDPAEAAAHFRAYLAIPDQPADKVEAVRSKWLPRAEEKLARVEVTAPAGAEVMVDGQAVVADPSLGLYEVLAGEHDIDVTRPGGFTERTHITAPPRSTVSVRAMVDDPPPPPPPSPSLPSEPAPEPARGPSGAQIGTVAGLGIAALGALGVGIGYDLAASQQARDIRASGGCVGTAACQVLGRDVSVQHQYEWTSLGGYIGAGAFAAAGVATWFLWPKAPVHVSGAMGTREVGLLVEGRFP
jgi:tetratricopeptide (TPR) repeat protein